jgi:hypothetical protein
MSDAKRVLAWWLVNPSDALTSTLSPEHFSDLRHRRLAHTLQRPGWTIDDAHSALVSDSDPSGALTYADIFDSSTGLLEHHHAASTLRLHDEYARKAAHAAATEFLGAIRGKGAKPIRKAILELVSALAEAEAMGPIQGRQYGQVAADVLATWLGSMANPDESPTLPLPWPQIDAHTGGWVVGKLHLIGGRSSEHKTTFARCCAEHLASIGVPCAYWTAEDSEVDIASRTLAANSDLLDTKALMLGRGPRGQNPTKGDLDRILGQAQKSIESPVGKNLHIIDIPNPRLSQIVTTIKTLAAKGYRAVFFDFLQLARPDSGQPTNDWWRDCIATLAGLAKQLGIVLVCTSQIEKSGTQASIQDERVPRADEMPFGAVLRQGAWACVMVGARIGKTTGSKLLVAEIDKWKSAENKGASEERGTFLFDVDAPHDRLIERRRK